MGILNRPLTARQEKGQSAAMAQLKHKLRHYLFAKMTSDFSRIGSDCKTNVSNRILRVFETMSIRLSVLFNADVLFVGLVGLMDGETNRIRLFYRCVPEFGNVL